MLEEEIYGENSPIWETDFTMPASDGTQLGHQTGEAGVWPCGHLAMIFLVGWDQTIIYNHNILGFSFWAVFIIAAINNKFCSDHGTVNMLLFSSRN